MGGSVLDGAERTALGCGEGDVSRCSRDAFLGRRFETEMGPCSEMVLVNV